mgnify:CR=1 FL=1
MAITKRGDKGSALTYQEMDDNFDAIAPRTSATGAVQVPAGTTGERPTGSEGQLRFNTASKEFEGFQGTTWSNIGAGGGGAGSPGIQGVQGTDGDAGAAGDPGLQGSAGDPGIEGDPGVQGFTGFQGTDGSQGDPGLIGVQGPAGSVQGLQGIIGEGIQGPEGATGPEGDGTQGAQGTAGSVQGIQGLIGPDGSDGFGSQGTSGIQGPAGSIQGLQGTIGPAGFGSQGIQGIQGIEGEVGDDGPAGLQGSDGAGAQGTRGFQGFQGDLGIQGNDGFGLQGIQGVFGNDGPQGVQGAGIQGPRGAGDAGVQGFQGAQGLAGDIQGPQGTSEAGTQGTQGVIGLIGIQGPFGPELQGIQGQAGSTQGITGEQGPGGVQGSQGTQGISLQGEQGLQGQPGVDAAGFQGSQGVQGTTSAQGVQGPQAFQGIQGFGGPGAIGVQGVQGNQGFVGEQGDDGIGIQGTFGIQGTQGLRGEIGSEGPGGSGGIQGTQGTQGVSEAGTQGIQGPTAFQGVQGLQGLEAQDPDVSADTSPQLGGDLDVNGQSIVSVSNGNIQITPDGTGSVILDGLSYPADDGTNGQVLTTDGSGNLTFADASNFVLSTTTVDNPNAYGTSDNDRFGAEVAVSGNYAIVGARQEDDAGGLTSGKAYIFNVTTGALVHTLDNPNAYGTSAGDEFGYAVAISGNRVIVGAQQEDDAGGTGSGKAYIFNVTTGALVHTLDNPNASGTSASDRFGSAVAISGNYAIVGAYLEDDAGANSGKAYIFNVTTGALVHTLDNPNAYDISAGDAFGEFVTISGNYAIVNARSEDDAGGTSSGKVYIYDVASGNLLYTLDNPNAYGTSASDFFGNSIAMSGNYIIVGAYLEDDAGGTSSGKVYIYDVASGNLLYTLNNPNAFGTSFDDYFGISVAMSGNYITVGAYNEDDAGGENSGKAYIYDISTFTTSTISSANYVLDNPNAYSTTTNDYFGNSVAISGNHVIVGAYGEDDAGATDISGKAYIFKIDAQPYAYTGSELSLFSDGISLATLKTEVAASTSFADFQTRIAAL